MNQKNQEQRQLTQDEFYAFEWRTRDMIAKGENPDEVKKQLVNWGLTEESAKTFVEAISKEEKGSKKDARAELVGLYVAAPIMFIGVLLIIGNRTGIFPTFPFAGFLVIILGIIVGSIVGYFASLTVK